MGLEPSRLRRGEVIAGAGGLVLLASMLFVTWYAVSSTFAPTLAAESHPTSWTGWTGLTILRWLMLVTVLAAFALVYFQAARRAPAVPVTISMIVTVLGLLTTIFLVIRVLIGAPSFGNPVSQKPGAYIALASACAILYGGYRSMREEGISRRDGPQEIPVVELTPTSCSRPG